MYVENQAVLRKQPVITTLREIMDELDIEPQDVKNRLSDSLKQKLLVEGYEAGAVRRSALESFQSLDPLFAPVQPEDNSDR
jgi:predicted transcriptional regulator